MRRLLRYLAVLGLLFVCETFAGTGTTSSPTILSEEWPPITYEENGVAKGSAVEIVQAMQTVMGDRLPILVVPWPRGYRTVQKEANVILFTVIRSKEREHLFTMLGPVGSGELALCGLEESKLNVHNLEDAKKVLAISANRESFFATTLEEAGFKNLVLSNEPHQEALLLVNKRVDLISGDPEVLKASLKNIGHENVRIKKYLIVEKFQYYIAFSLSLPQFGGHGFMWYNPQNLEIPNGTEDQKTISKRVSNPSPGISQRA